MSQLSNGGRRRLISSLLLLFLLSTSFLPVPAAHAQGGIAMAGTFYQQEFELPQGTEISSPSVYVIVFNHTGEEMSVQMRSEAPFGVEVLFDQATFSLPPGGEQKVFITVKVTDDAVPGEYEVTVSARASPKGGEGVKLATASAQKASLVVTGEAAQLSVRVIIPDGSPIKAQVKLFKVIEDRLNEIERSETGTLEARVSPGIYRVSAYIAGRKLAEETVELGAEERKEITLVVKPVYFEFFSIEPNFTPDTEQLTFVRVVYTLNNLSQPLNDGEVFLQVSFEDKPLEHTSLISLSRLDIGRTEGSYSYVPAEGWREGDYGLRLRLYIEGELYIESAEEELGLTPGLTPKIKLTSPILPVVAAQFEVVAVQFEVVDVTEIEITAKTMIVEGKVQIKQTTDPPPGVPAVVAPWVYSYLEAITEEIADEAVGVAVIKFKVPKSWLELRPGSNVILYHYNIASSQWDPLPTQQVTDDAEYVYYSAESPGLSFFAIASVKPAVSAVWWIVTGIAVIVVAAVLVFVVRRRRQKPDEKPPTAS